MAGADIILQQGPTLLLLGRAEGSCRGWLVQREENGRHDTSDWVRNGGEAKQRARPKRGLDRQTDRLTERRAARLPPSMPGAID